MSKNTIEIKRWDAVLFGNNEYPTPIIYVKADPNLLDFAESKDNALLITIKSTNSIYDNKIIPAVFAKSSEIPNCRPVYFNSTKLYVMVLQSEWHGYPESLGYCEIHELKSSEQSTVVDNKPLKESFQETKENNCDGLNLSSLLSISFGIAFIFILVLLVNKK